MLAAPAAALAQDAEGGTDAAPATQNLSAPGTGAGGAEYGVDPAAPPRVFVPGTKAVRMDNGFAAAPADAPAQIQNAIFATNEIVGLPYKYGGGHARGFKDSGYDCSGTISFALNGAGAKWLKSPLDSSSFMSWGKKGKGKWVTVYTKPSHAFLVIAGLRLDTSSYGERVSSGEGPRWRKTPRGGAGYVKRHPKGF